VGPSETRKALEAMRYCCLGLMRVVGDLADYLPYKAKASAGDTMC